MYSFRSNWDRQVAQAELVSEDVAELSALSEPEMDSLLDFLRERSKLPFYYLSVHGPSKDLSRTESELVDALVEIAQFVDSIVMHPDTIENFSLFRKLGSKLVIENMDSRKSWGRTVSELEEAFEQLPEAGFCFDIAHAWSVDSSMHEGERMIESFGERLRQVHVSSLSADLRHESLTDFQASLFSPLLRDCRNVPWVLEAPMPE